MPVQALFIFMILFSHSLICIAHSSVGAELAGESMVRDRIFVHETVIEIVVMILAVALPWLI